MSKIMYILLYLRKNEGSMGRCISDSKGYVEIMLTKLVACKILYFYFKIYERFSEDIFP